MGISNTILFWFPVMINGDKSGGLLVLLFRFEVTSPTIHSFGVTES